MPSTTHRLRSFNVSNRLITASCSSIKSSPPGKLTAKSFAWAIAFLKSLVYFYEFPRQFNDREVMLMVAYSLEKLLFGLWSGNAYCLLCQFQYSNELWQKVLIEAYRKSVCSHWKEWTRLTRDITWSYLRIATSRHFLSKRPMTAEWLLDSRKTYLTSSWVSPILFSNIPLNHRLITSSAEIGGWNTFKEISPSGQKCKFNMSNKRFKFDWLLVHCSAPRYSSIPGLSLGCTWESLPFSHILQLLPTSASKFRQIVGYYWRRAKWSRYRC